MSSHEALIRLFIERGVLQFGRFQLKSGRMAPYFFNLAKIHDAVGLTTLGNYYAAAINQQIKKQGRDFDLIFGPAYKGIALSVTTALALQKYHIHASVCFNRKEQKQYGDGGIFIGAEVRHQRVILVDDVLTAGTAIREAITLLRNAGAVPVAVFIALDRQETAVAIKQDTQQKISTIDALTKQTGVPVHALIRFEAILDYLQKHPEEAINLDWQATSIYRSRFGCLS